MREPPNKLVRGVRALAVLSITGLASCSTNPDAGTVKVGGRESVDLLNPGVPGANDPSMAPEGATGAGVGGDNRAMMPGKRGSVPQP